MIPKGDQIGEGEHRIVYEHATDSSRVVKTARIDWGRRCNEIEWKIWQLVASTEYSVHFCPVYEISNDHKDLVMARAQPTDALLPAAALPMLADGKVFDMHVAANHGVMADHRIVLVDYGNLALFHRLSAYIANSCII